MENLYDYELLCSLTFWETNERTKRMRDMIACFSFLSSFSPFRYRITQINTVIKRYEVHKKMLFASTCIHLLHNIMRIFGMNGCSFRKKGRMKELKEENAKKHDFFAYPDRTFLQNCADSTSDA